MFPKKDSEFKDALEAKILKTPNLADPIWDSAQEERKKLQLVGRMSQITWSNATLTKELIERFGMTSSGDLPKLAETHGEADAWIDELERLAKGVEKPIENLIPPAFRSHIIQSSDPEEVFQGILSSYGAHLARKVRLAFPIQTSLAISGR